ncbi:hypothetical protein WJX73_006198 [Symbiochloris irregularis]|uniref:Uncharacterized protein n=1 Tax=Symbiochloris irregularis TaxID=706552 RepID=A0AAW1P9Z9_9CHLO
MPDSAKGRRDVAKATIQHAKSPSSSLSRTLPAPSLPADVWCLVFAKLEVKCTGQWMALKQGGQGWQVQKVPEGIDEPAPVPKQAFTAWDRRPQHPCCIASSCDYCEVMQVVDLHAQLVERGVPSDRAIAFLDQSPRMQFSVWLKAPYHDE